MPSLSDDVGALRRKSDRLLRQLTNGDLKRFHSKLVAVKGNWCPAGDASSVRGPQVQEFQSFNFSLKRPGRESRMITIEFLRSSKRGWTVSHIHIEAATPKSFQWNGRRWVCSTFTD